MNTPGSNLNGVVEERCDLSDFIEDFFDAEAGVFRLTHWGQHSFIYSRASPQHVRVLQENGCGLYILRHGRCTEDIHNYFRKFESHKCCLGLAGAHSLRTKLRLVKSDSYTQNSIEIGIDVASPTSAFASQVDLMLSDEEYRTFKCALWCSLCPLLTAHKPPDDKSPPLSPAEQPRPSSINNNQRYSQVSANIYASTIPEFKPNDDALVSSEIMRDVLRRAFGLNKHLEMYYLKLAYKFHKTKNDALILAEDLCYQLSLLEKNTHPYYNHVSFMSRQAYEIWRHQTRRHLMELLNKFWCNTMPPVGEVAKFDAYNIHSDYRMLLHKLLRLQRLQCGRDQNTAAFSVIPSGATQRILAEFRLRYGINELYHLAIYLEYLALNFGIEKEFINLVTKTIQNIMSVLPREKTLLMRQQIEQLQLCVNLLFHRCEHLFSRIQTIVLSTSCNSSIASLICLLEEVVRLNGYLSRSEIELQSTSQILQGYLEVNFQLVYNEHKISAFCSPTGRNDAGGHLSPRVINRIMSCLRDDLADYRNNYQTLFERYFSVTRLASVALYELLMSDVLELCQLFESQSAAEKINLGMIGLIYRLNILDHDWQEFIPLQKQVWREAYFDHITYWFSAVYHQVENFLRRTLAGEQFIPLCIPWKLLLEDEMAESFTDATVSTMPIFPSRSSAFSVVPQNQMSNAGHHDQEATSTNWDQTHPPAKDEVLSSPQVSRDFKISNSCDDILTGNASASNIKSDIPTADKVPCSSDSKFTSGFSPNVVTSGSKTENAMNNSGTVKNIAVDAPISTGHKSDSAISGNKKIFKEIPGKLGVRSDTGSKNQTLSDVEVASGRSTTVSDSDQMIEKIEEIILMTEASQHSDFGEFGRESFEEKGTVQGKEEADKGLPCPENSDSSDLVGKDEVLDLERSKYDSGFTEASLSIPVVTEVQNSVGGSGGISSASEQGIPESLVVKADDTELQLDLSTNVSLDVDVNLAPEVDQREQNDAVIKPNQTISGVCPESVNSATNSHQTEDLLSVEDVPSTYKSEVQCLPSDAKLNGAEVGASGANEGANEQSLRAYLTESSNGSPFDKETSSTSGDDDEDNGDSHLPKLKLIGRLMEGAKSNDVASPFVESSLPHPAKLIKPAENVSSGQQPHFGFPHEILRSKASTPRADGTQSGRSSEETIRHGSRTNKQHNVVFLVTSSLVDVICLVQRLTYVIETLGGSLYHPMLSRRGNDEETEKKMADSRDYLKAVLEEMIQKLICLYAKNLLAMDLCAVSQRTAAELIGNQLVEDLKQSRAAIWGCRHKLSGVDCMQYYKRHEEFRDSRYEPLAREMCFRINNLLEIGKIQKMFFEKAASIWSLSSSCSLHGNNSSILVTEYLNSAITGLINILAYRMQLFTGNFLAQLVTSQLPSRSDLDTVLQPLKNFLTKNLQALQRWLYPENYFSFLDQFWLSLSRCFEKCAVDVEHNPSRTAEQYADRLLQTVVIIIRLVMNLQVSDPSQMKVQYMDTVVYWLQLYSQSTPRLISTYQILCLKKTLGNQDIPLPFGCNLETFERMRCDLHSNRKCFQGRQLIDWIANHLEAFVATNSQSHEDGNSDLPRDDQFEQTPSDLAQVLLEVGAVLPVEGVRPLSSYSSSTVNSEPFPRLIICGTIKQLPRNNLASEPLLLPGHSDLTKDYRSSSTEPETTPLRPAAFESANREPGQSSDANGEPDGTGNVVVRRLPRDQSPKLSHDHSLNSSRASTEDASPIFNVDHWYQIPSPEEAVMTLSASEVTSAGSLQELRQCLQFFVAKRVKKGKILSILASRKDTDQHAGRFIHSLPREIINRYPWLYLKEQTVLACLGLY